LDIQPSSWIRRFLFGTHSHGPQPWFPITEFGNYDSLADLCGDLNAGQRQSVFSALHNLFTFAQGPPGTGKTDVIAHILLAILKGHRKGMVVAETNHAIKQALKTALEVAKKDDSIDPSTFILIQAESTSPNEAWDDDMFKVSETVAMTTTPTNSSETDSPLPRLRATSTPTA
jgi:hypothetical protein